MELFKRSLFLGIAAAVLATLASVILQMIFKKALYVDFGLLLPWWKIMAACFVGCILASIGFVLIMLILPKQGEIVFNLLFAVLSFASIMSPMLYLVFKNQKLSEDAMMALDYVQYFAIILHFFPIVSWLTLKPLFIKK